MQSYSGGRDSILGTSRDVSWFRARAFLEVDDKDYFRVKMSTEKCETDLSMQENPSRTPKVSLLSHKAGLVRPGRKSLCSGTAQWHSVLLQTFDQPGCVDAFETAISPDYLLVLSLQGEYDIESFSGRTWKKATYRPGTGGLTSPLTQNYLRWRSPTPTTQVLRIYIPEAYFLEVGEEYRRAGSKVLLRLPDTLQFSDPIVAGVARSLAEQVRLGAPNLYAEAGARFLAAHLLLTMSGSAVEARNRPAATDLTDQRFRRVLDYMQHHFAEDTSLDILAREAGISLFHFTRLFKARLGVTPHRHLVQLRMQHAQTLLRFTDLSIAEVAQQSGYVHLGHFAAAFKRDSGTLPTVFRRESRMR